MVAPLVWWGGGAAIAALLGLRARKVAKDKAAAAAAAQAPQAAAPSPAQVAAVTPAQVNQAAAAAGITPAQLSAAAQAAGTTPQAVIAAAQNAGSSVADAIIAAQNGTPLAQVQAAAQDPSLQAQINPASVQQNQGTAARVTTNDPPPSGDLIIRSGPSASSPQIGGAEKDGVVFILGDAGNGFSQISWPGGTRLPAADGFAHTSALNTSFNGDDQTDAEKFGGDYR